MQNRLLFSIRGGDSDSYEVRFERDGQNMSAFCTCVSAQSSKYCDHRFALLEGDTTNLASGNGDQISVLREWLKGSDIEAAMIALKKAKSELELAKEKVDYCRQVLLKRMMD